MPRKMRPFLVWGLSLVLFPAAAAAQESSDTATADDSQPAPEPVAAASDRPLAQSKAAEAKTEPEKDSWRTEIHGYFRAPMALGLSKRPDPDPNNPDNPTGPERLQISYGPNRVMDWSYYSFAYTTVQEQDWAELFFHQKKKHVDAVVGWMGYWYGAAGYRNPDASWLPGMAYLTLDTDFELAGFKPNLAFTMGSWWPKFGYVEKYDTYTLGRFRQLGEQLKLAVPVDDDSTVSLIEGIGTNRDGSYTSSLNANPLYAGKTGIDMIGYANLQYTYRKLLDISLHYNYTFTRDTRLSADMDPTSGKGYVDASKAHLWVAGAEVNLSLPTLGRLWLSPSYLSVKNGWALGGGGGTEVMHSQGGAGVAANYMAFSGSPDDAEGSGTMLNLGFLYENSLSNIQGRPSTHAPDVKFSVFGLMTNVSVELPKDSFIKQSKLKQLKYGADVTVQAVDWLGFMLRGDTVNYDTEHGGYIFSAITSRLVFSSHFLSGETIYLQYSRYIYGDKMVLAGKWDWNTPLVAGADVVQSQGGYPGKKPDANVIKLQASVAF